MKADIAPKARNMMIQHAVRHVLYNVGNPYPVPLVYSQHMTTFDHNSTIIHLVHHLVQ